MRSFPRIGAHLTLRNLVLALTLGLSPLSHAKAQPMADAAFTRAETFDGALLAASRHGELKAAKFQSVIEQSFNLPVMAQIAVGPSWATMSGADRLAIVQAMTRYTAARFQHDLGTFNGQKIVLEPTVQVRGVDHLVKGQLLEPNETPVRLVYRLREYAGTWRIIDIFYDGVSQLATERADFAASLANGARTLVKKLDEASAKLRG